MNKEEPEEMFIGKYVLYVDKYDNFFLKRYYLDSRDIYLHKSMVIVETQLEQKDIDKINKTLDGILKGKIELYGVNYE